MDALITTFIVPTLIMLGVGVMLVSILKTRQILRLLQPYQEAGLWRVLYILMIFFLGGYLLADYLSIASLMIAITILMGVVFFCGSLFVLLSIRVYHHTLLITLNDYRQAKQDAETTLQKLKHTQAQLVHNEKMLGLERIAARIAHEINYPVKAIYGNLHQVEEYSSELLQLVRSYQSDSPRHYPKAAPGGTSFDLAMANMDLPQLLQSMRSGTDRIRRVVELLSQFSSLNEPQFKTIELRNTLESTINVFRGYQKTAFKIPVEITASYGSLPLVACNPREINQALVNLLVNAADAIETKGQQFQAQGQSSWVGRIDIQAAALEPEQVQIVVADNGIGIPESERDRVFEPFFTTKTDGKGTGLGLSIAHQIIVAKHHGAIACDSTPDQGTRFTIKLPVCP